MLGAQSGPVAAPTPALGMISMAPVSVAILKHPAVHGVAVVAMPDKVFGEKAYRGEKLSRSTWPTILASPYVAQLYVPPSRLRPDHVEGELKVDLRANAWGGRVVQLAARLYQGQTTNFRTPGGGFAPVFTDEPAVRQG